MSKAVPKSPGKDSKKEKIFKILSEVLTDAGYTIRREELKRGFGWRAVSGACRLEESRLLFIDRRMTQEDQITFLAHKIATLGIEMTEEKSVELRGLGWALEGGAAAESRV